MDQDLHTFKRLPQLVLRLTQPQHQTRLRNQPLIRHLRRFQHAQTLPKLRPPIPHTRRQLLHRLHVMRIDIQPALRHDLDHLQIARIVARQRLHQHRRRLLLDFHDRLREMVRAAVAQVVAVHGRQDNVAKSPARKRLGRVLGLVRVQGRWRLGRLDGAEAAAPRARVAHQHDGGRRGGFLGPAPAVGDVGASRFFADGVQVEAAQVVLDLLVVLPDGDGRLQP